METKAILPDNFDSSKSRIPKLNRVFMSNRLDCLSDKLIKNLFINNSDTPIRTIVIIPSNIVKTFLTQHLTKKLGFVFGIRFLTLPQAVEYFTKLSTKNTLNIPNHHCLMLHIQALLQKSISDRSNENLQLIEYLQKDETKILSLAEELSHVFLQYGLYGGLGLKKWEAKANWQQNIWKCLKKFWHFPCDLINNLQTANIYHSVHLFDISFIPPLYQTLLNHLEKFWNINYYFRSPTPHYWGDFLSQKTTAYLDKKFEEKTISENQRIDFASLTNDAHPLLANLSMQAQPLFNYLIDKDYTETYEPYEDSTLLNRLKNDIYHLETRQLEVDDTIEISSSPSKLREVETLLHQLKKFHYQKEMNIEDVIVYLVDVDAYFPFIQFVFESDDSPFGYRISDLTTRLQNPNFKALHDFFHLTESRFEPELIFELFLSKAFKTPFPKEELLFFQKLIEMSNIHWGFDDKMRNDILGTDIFSQGGSWTFAFKSLIQNIVYLDSPIDLSKAENFGEFIHLIESLYQDLLSLKEKKASLLTWIETITFLIGQYFYDSDETKNFIKEFAKIGIHNQEKDSELSCEDFSFPSIEKILSEIFNQKGKSHSYATKPPITFTSIKEGTVAEAKMICLLGLNEESFPRKTHLRSINELKGLKDVDHQPQAQEKDRLFFLQAILGAQDKLFISYVGISGLDGKELEPSILLNELFNVIPKLHVNKEPPFAFSKKIIEKEHFSQQNYLLSQAFYLPKEPPSPLKISVLPTPKVLNVDIASFIKLAKHPLQFYCNQTLGIFLDRKNKSREKEFVLSYLDRALLKNKAIHLTIEDILKEAIEKNLLPTALLHTCAVKELNEEISQLKKSLKVFSLTKEDFIAIRFEPSCNTTITLSNQKKILPPIEITASNGQKVILFGNLPNITNQGIFSPGKEEFKELWKYLPNLLLLANTPLAIPNKILFAKTHSEKSIELINPREALRSYLDYYLEASSDISPLMPDKVEALSKGLLKEFKITGLLKDPYAEFINPNNLEKWSSYAGDLCKILK